MRAWAVLYYRINVACLQHYRFPLPVASNPIDRDIAFIVFLSLISWSSLMLCHCTLYTSRVNKRADNKNTVNTNQYTTLIRGEGQFRPCGGFDGPSSVPPGKADRLPQFPRLPFHPLDLLLSIPLLHLPWEPFVRCRPRPPSNLRLGVSDRLGEEEEEENDDNKRTFNLGYYPPRSRPASYQLLSSPRFPPPSMSSTQTST